MYADGVVMARCDHCYQRIEIDRIPGSQAVVLAKGLVAALVEGDDRTDLIVAGIGELERQLDADEQAIHEARRVLQIARVKLGGRLLGRLSQ